MSAPVEQHFRLLLSAPCQLSLSFTPSLPCSPVDEVHVSPSGQGHGVAVTIAVLEEQQLGVPALPLCIIRVKHKAGTLKLGQPGQARKSTYMRGGSSMGV